MPLKQQYDLFSTPPFMTFAQNMTEHGPQQSPQQKAPMNGQGELTLVLIVWAPVHGKQQNACTQHVGPRLLQQPASKVPSFIIWFMVRIVRLYLCWRSRTLNTAASEPEIT